MKRMIDEALPGFVGVRQLFQALGTDFEPVVLEESRQDFYISKIEELEGYPEDLFFNLKWIWRIDPHFHEARKYPNGVTLVRIGVGAILEGVGISRDRQSLIMVFDAQDKMLCYTVIAGSGKLDGGVRVVTYREATGMVEDNRFEVAEQFVPTMKPDDFLIIEDAAFSHQYFQVLAGFENGQTVFSVEYCLENFVFHFVLPRHVSVEAVQHLVSELKSGGFVALQAAAPWMQMDVDGYWKSNGRDLEVDIGLLAHIYRREVKYGDEAAEELRNIFNRRDGGDPLSVRVKFGSIVEMAQELLRLAEDRQRFTESEQWRIAVYARLLLCERPD